MIGVDRIMVAVAIVLAVSAGTIRAHGSAEMPVWGEVFVSDPLNDTLEVRMKVRRLAQHLRNIQEPNG